VVTAIPEIMEFEIDEKTDFIILGCKNFIYIKLGDGIFDQIKSEEAVEAVWKLVNEEAIKINNIHSICIKSVDLIMKTSLLRKSYDNITLLIVAFENFEKKIESIFKEHEKSKYPNKFLRTNDFDLNKLNSSKSLIRVETENYTSKNHFSKNTILESEPATFKNINSTLDNDYYNNTFNSQKKFNCFSNHIIPKLNKNSNHLIEHNNKAINLQNLIKNQIDTSTKNKSRSVNKQYLFNSNSVEINKEHLIKYTNNESLEKEKKSIDIPAINTAKKLNGNSNNFNNENVNKNNFYRNLFINEGQNLEKDPQALLREKESNNITIKNLTFEKTKKIKIPIKTNNNFFGLGVLNFNQTNNNKSPKKYNKDKFVSNTSYDKYREKSEFKYTYKRVNTETNN